MNSKRLKGTQNYVLAAAIACIACVIAAGVGAAANVKHRTAPAFAPAASPAATAPYSVNVFATSVAGQYTGPDSIAVLGNLVFIGYNNGTAKDGTDGKSSTIVEYSMQGAVLTTFSVLGHNDGLRVNPQTGQLWAMQNEDGNPSLTIIDPRTGTQASYTFAPTVHGGGFDDIAFRNGDVFFSASNPMSSPNTAPAIVKAQLITASQGQGGGNGGAPPTGGQVVVSPVLFGNAAASDIPTASPVTLNLQDPDSMIFNPLGDLVLDSQADSELVIVHHPGLFDQTVFSLQTTMDGSPVQVDDTIFATSSFGTILVSDPGADIVYAITRPIFAPNAAYTAAPTAVGTLDFNTGVITPVVSGFSGLRGMAFIGH